MGRDSRPRYAFDMQFTARIWPEEGGFVAECVELKVVSQGDTEDEALINLQEAVMGFLEHADPAEIRERMHAGMQIRTFDVAV
jgi:predicted RNase H-like HicB family nuclease